MDVPADEVPVPSFKILSWMSTTMACSSSFVSETKGVFDDWTIVYNQEGNAVSPRCSSSSPCSNFHVSLSVVWTKSIKVREHNTCSCSGMDPTNERRVFALLVKVLCSGNASTQYFMWVSLEESVTASHPNFCQTSTTETRPQSTWFITGRSMTHRSVIPFQCSVFQTCHLDAILRASYSADASICS